MAFANGRCKHGCLFHRHWPLACRHGSREHQKRILTTAKATERRRSAALTVAKTETKLKGENYHDESKLQVGLAD